MATWADIQRLAADLQRVQSTDSAKKLSEANCVEIISTLINNGAINLVVTNNGKEYVTKKHLVTEVKNECLAAGGRINITELVPILRIELDHIETATSTLINEDPDEFVLCSGELVSREYINDLCKRLNESLSAVGQLSMYQLSKQWDLPTDLLNHYVLANLGTQIDATRFEDQIYTRQFYQLQRNKLRAALISLTKPTSLSSLFASFDIPQALFFNIWNELSEANQLHGHLLGSKGSIKSIYVPRQHDLLVREYVKNAFLSNDFIEISTLKKLSIANVQAYFKELLPTEKFNECVFLQSGVVNQEVWKQTIKGIEERIDNDLYCSIEQHLPSILSDLSPTDIEVLITVLTKARPSLCIIAGGDEHVVYEKKFIEKTLESLEPWLQDKAKIDGPTIVDRLKELQTQQTKKVVNEVASKKAVIDDDDDWSNEKSGKKKGGKGGKKGNAPSAKSKPTAQTSQQNQAPTDLASLLKLNTNELEEQLQNVVQVPDSLFTELMENLHQPANQKYKELVEATIRSVDQVDGKRSHEEKRQKAQSTYDQICVFESGLSEFPGLDSLAADLQAYLLKSLASDFCFQTLSAFADCPQDLSNISVKLRDELIGSIMDTETRDVITDLFAAQRLSLEQFHVVVEKLQNACSFMIRQPDKKTRSEIIEERKSSLRNKIEEITDDAPTLLLLIVLYLFASNNQDGVIHASGKFVGPLIKQLAFNKDISSSLIEQLNEVQRLVVECVKKRNANGGLSGELTEKLDRLKSQVLS